MKEIGRYLTGFFCSSYIKFSLFNPTTFRVFLWLKSQSPNDLNFGLVCRRNYVECEGVEPVATRRRNVIGAIAQY